MKRRAGVKVLAALAAIALLSLGGIAAFRLWVRGAPARDAPTVGLAIGDDVLNDVGVHQAAYQAALTRAGARVVEVSPDGEPPPVGLAPRASDGDATAEQVLDRIDALVLTGGGDLDPAVSGAEGEAQLVDSARDAFEIALVRGAIERDMPLLAVCRGHQVLNVALGGTVRDARGTPTGRTHGITPRSLSAHAVTLARGSLVRELAGAPRLRVNSFHGQVVDRVAPDLRVTARAPDGVVEALEVPGATYALGIQWHPEILSVSDAGAQAVFARLVEEARGDSAHTDPEREPAAP